MFDGVDPNDLCAIHGYEPIPVNYYRICGECHHCFVTEQELVNSENEILRRLGIDSVTTRGSDVTICPECTHDF